MALAHVLCIHENDPPFAVNAPIAVVIIINGGIELVVASKSVMRDKSTRLCLAKNAGSARRVSASDAVALAPFSQNSATDRWSLGPGAGRTVKSVFLIEFQQRVRASSNACLAPRKLHRFQNGFNPGRHRSGFAERKTRELVGGLGQYRVIMFCPHIVRSRESALVSSGFVQTDY